MWQEDVRIFEDVRIRAFRGLTSLGPLFLDLLLLLFRIVPLNVILFGWLSVCDPKSGG